MEEPTKNFQDNSNQLILFVWKKRKLIGLVSLVVAVLTTIVTLLMTPLYLSTAIVFPAATSTVSFSEQRNAKASSMDFGEEEQAEQLVQILSSSRIRDIVVSRFDLMKHYEIKENDPNKYYKLGQAYSNHITFTRTKYGSIQIDVLDEDKELAAVIANKIVQLIDTVKNQMVKERTIPAFEINKRKKQIIESTLFEVNKKMDSLSNIGVVTAEARANLFQAYNDAKSPTDKAYFKNQLEVNAKHGAEFEALMTLRDEKTVKLAEFEDSYEQAESDAYTDFNHKFIVENAVVADKKEKPKRAIIIIVTTLLSMILLVFFLLIKDRFKQIKELSNS
jgi:tyrosine-protein kinase Etk/Wzc